MILQVGFRVSGRLCEGSVGDIVTGLLSNQGEKSIKFYFIVVLLRKKY